MNNKLLKPKSKIQQIQQKSCKKMQDVNCIYFRILKRNVLTVIITF